MSLDSHKSETPSSQNFPCHTRQARMVLPSTSKSTETLYLDLDKPPKGWQWFAGNREQMGYPHLFLPADYRVPCLQPKSLFWAQIQKHVLPGRQKTTEWVLSIVPDQALRTQNETIRQVTIAIPGKERVCSKSPPTKSHKVRRAGLCNCFLLLIWILARNKKRGAFCLAPPDPEHR